MINSEDLEITDLFEHENDNAASASAARWNEGDADEGNANDESTTTTVKGAAKRIIRNPQPKLNPQRLCGDRGIVQLPKIFSEVKLKGKGHEKDDLDRVMKSLEHWSHRLFPKFTFDDVLERIEKLGSKKAVQNCVSRIRLDMPILAEDYVSNRDDNIVDSEDENPPPVIDEQLHASIFGPASTSQESHHVHETISLEAPKVTQTLTADQLAQIEQNRLKALERRAARLLEAAQSVPKLNEDTSLSAENTLSTSTTLPVNTKGHTGQTGDSDGMLIDEDLHSALNDSDVITTTMDSAPSGLESIFTICEQVTQNKTTEDEVHTTAKSGTSPSSSQSSSQNGSNSPSGGNLIISDNEVAVDKIIIATKSQCREEDIEYDDAIEKENVSDQTEAHMDVDETEVSE